MSLSIEWNIQEGMQSQRLVSIPQSDQQWKTTSGGVGPAELLTPNKLFLYFDESGNLDFGHKGTDIFLLTCLVAHRPFPACQRLMNLHYDCLEKGIDIEEFHASEDGPETRKEVYDVLSLFCDHYDAYVFHVNKTNLGESYKDPAVLYSKTFAWLIDEIFKQEYLENCSQVIAITDTLPKEAKKRAVVKPLKEAMKRTFQGSGIPYVLMHHSSQSDYNLQIADYVCWAAQRDIARGQDWPKTKIKAMFAGLGTITEEAE